MLVYSFRDISIIEGFIKRGGAFDYLSKSMTYIAFEKSVLVKVYIPKNRVTIFCNYSPPPISLSICLYFKTAKYSLHLQPSPFHHCNDSPLSNFVSTSSHNLFFSQVGRSLLFLWSKILFFVSWENVKSPLTTSKQTKTLSSWGQLSFYPSIFQVYVLCCYSGSAKTQVLITSAGRVSR